MLGQSGRWVLSPARAYNVHWVSHVGRTALAVVVHAYAVEHGQARSVPYSRRWIHAKDTSVRPIQRSAILPTGILTLIAVWIQPMSMGLAMMGTYMPLSSGQRAGAIIIRW